MVNISKGMVWILVITTVFCSRRQLPSDLACSFIQALVVKTQSSPPDEHTQSWNDNQKTGREKKEESQSKQRQRQKTDKSFLYCFIFPESSTKVQSEL